MAGDNRFDMDTLLAMARDKSVAGREALATAVTDIFGVKTGALTERELALMHDILTKLIRDVEKSVRRILAARLADLPDAPKDIVIALANDEIDIARPVLRRSSILQDVELIEIIRHRTLEHQLAITLRKEISENVTNALVEAGNTDVIQSLLENQNAVISEKTMEYLVEQSERVDSFQNPLVRRKDLSPALAKRLCLWVSDALQAHLVETYGIEKTALDEALRQTVEDVVQNEHAAADHRSARTELAEHLIELKAVEPDVLTRLLREGEVSLFEALLNKLTGLPTKLIWRFLTEPDGERLGVVCKAIRIRGSDFASIYMLSRKVQPGKHIMQPSELSRLLTFYDQLNIEAATNMVYGWQADPDRLLATAHDKAKDTADVAR